MLLTTAQNTERNTAAVLQAGGTQHFLLSITMTVANRANAKAGLTCPRGKLSNHSSLQSVSYPQVREGTNGNRQKHGEKKCPGTTEQTHRNFIQVSDDN